MEHQDTFELDLMSMHHAMLDRGLQGLPFSAKCMRNAATNYYKLVRLNELKTKIIAAVVLGATYDGIRFMLRELKTLESEPFS